eukprot:CAMPEP_0184065606 /NCGR_PEP_ID=MMETSP0957-20130417/2869_1 /TAXON_ID=627963 /ORGANISM="Aplanochytrium sp, Strain PBS07" /LENGTH=47 /DNA_ID= /DNA_START= /DNA_END= /DNA_ORIENTATION=
MMIILTTTEAYTPGGADTQRWAKTIEVDRSSTKASNEAIKLRMLFSK